METETEGEKEEERKTETDIHIDREIDRQRVETKGETQTEGETETETQKEGETGSLDRSGLFSHAVKTVQTPRPRTRAGWETVCNKSAHVTYTQGAC